MTSKLPACTSAWNVSQYSTDVIHVLSALMRVVSGSAEVTARMASRSVSGDPYRRSMVSRRLEEYWVYTYGHVATARVPERSRNSENCATCVASLVKSTCRAAPCIPVSERQ